MLALMSLAREAYSSSCDTVCKSVASKVYFFSGAVSSPGELIRYRWTTTNNIRIALGQGTDTVTLDFLSASVGGAKICAIAFNDCDSSVPVCFNVSIVSCEKTSDTIILVNKKPEDTSPIVIVPPIPPKPGESVKIFGPFHGSGTASINTATGVVTFKPSLIPYIGRDTIIKVTCSGTNCDTQRIAMLFKSPPSYFRDTTLANVSLTFGKIPDRIFEGKLNPPAVFTSSGATVSISVIDGRITYTPSKNFAGNDSFYIVRCDVVGNCDTAYYHVVVLPNDNLLDSIPNYFSPNSDGQNDFWRLPDQMFVKYPNLKLIIYNRNGDIVWRSIGRYANNSKDGFRGYHLITGNELPDGVYYYLLELDLYFKNTATGFIELMRK